MPKVTGKHRARAKAQNQRGRLTRACSGLIARRLSVFGDSLSLGPSVTGVYSQQDRCGISGRSFFSRCFPRPDPGEGPLEAHAFRILGEVGAAGRLLTEP
jgi:hypothetical protein